MEADGKKENGHLKLDFYRFWGAMVAGGGLTVAIVVCHLATGEIPGVLPYSLAVLVGWLCRDASTPKPNVPYPSPQTPATPPR